MTISRGLFGTSTARTPPDVQPRSWSSISGTSELTNVRAVSKLLSNDAETTTSIKLEPQHHYTHPAGEMSRSYELWFKCNKSPAV